MFIFTPRIFIKYFLKFLAYTITKLNLKHSKIARANLNLAFDDNLNDNEKNNIIEKSYLTLLYNMYEFVDNQYASKEKILSKANIIGEEHVLKAQKDNRQIIFIGYHYGAWEVSVPFIGLKYGKVGIVNRKMNNKYINDEYVKARDKNNIIMIDKKVAAKGMLKAIKNGYNLAVIIDQNTPSGIDIDFFSHKTKATDSTSRLAFKFDALLIPVFCTINELGSYTIEFLEPLESKDYKGDNQINDLTQAQANILEDRVTKLPEQWFWQHKRWKFFYPDMYKNL